MAAFRCPSAPADLVQVGVAVNDTFGSGPPGDTYHMGVLFPNTADFAGKVWPTLPMVTDGTSNTFVFGERAAPSQHWVKGRKVSDVNPVAPAYFAPWAFRLNVTNQSFTADGLTPVAPGWGACPQINCNNGRGIYSFHTGGANFVMLDGSVRFVRESVSGQTLAALFSRQGGEVAPGDAY